MTATAIDWNYEAGKAVDYIAQFRHREQHGAIAWEPAGTALVFLNDCDQKPRTAQAALALLRQHLDEAGIKTLGVASTPDRGAWALVAISDHLGFLKGAAAAAWRAAADRTRYPDRQLDQLLADAAVACDQALDLPPPSAIFRRVM